MSSLAIGKGKQYDATSIFVFGRIVYPVQLDLGLKHIVSVFPTYSYFHYRGPSEDAPILPTFRHQSIVNYETSALLGHLSLLAWG